MNCAALPLLTPLLLPLASFLPLAASSSLNHLPKATACVGVVARRARRCERAWAPDNVLLAAARRHHQHHPHLGDHVVRQRHQRVDGHLVERVERAQRRADLVDAHINLGRVLEEVRAEVPRVEVLSALRQRCGVCQERCGAPPGGHAG